MIPRVFVITDWTKGRAHVERVAAALTPLGREVGLIHRNKSATGRALLEDGERLKRVLHGSDVALFVNGRPDVALALGANLQLHSQAYAAREARALLGPTPLVMVSVHRPEELDRLDGANAALVAPVFAPRSKPDDSRPPLGLEGWARFHATHERPTVALGGMTPERAGQLGCRAVAACGAFFETDRPLELAQQFLRSLPARTVAASERP